MLTTFIQILQNAPFQSNLQNFLRFRRQGGSGVAGPLAARAVVKFDALSSGVTSCYLRKERTNIRYKLRPAPTQNWRNADKVEPDAAKDPML